MAIKRQTIMTAIKTRMQGILKTSSYQTDIGNHVITDRPRLLGPDGSIGSAIVEASELPCVIISDPQDDIAPDTFTTDLHRLTVELEVRAENSATTETEVRKMMADVYKAIGTDTTWGGVAVSTERIPPDEKIHIQGDKIIGGALIKIAVVFQTDAWQET